MGRKRNKTNCTGNPSQKRVKKHFGFKHLEELCNKEPSDIVFVICNKSNGFIDLFSQNKDPDWLFLLMKTTVKVSNTEFSESKRFILSEICQNRRFLDHLLSYIQTSPTEINKYRRENMGVFYENCLTVCQAITELFQKTAAERLNMLINGFIEAMSEIQKNICLDKIKINNDVIMSKITKILQQFTNLKTNNAMIKTDKNGEQNFEPLENFRLLSVYPIPGDMDSGKPFLRPNIIEGAYNSVEHYLDVQFRLLREDFVAPLRNGIQCYKENDRNYSDGRKKINDIHIYRNVQFEINSTFIQDKMGYTINFNQNNRLKINWDISKRFMYGSLLIFTADEFNHFFLGVVLCRDKQFLKNGQLVVEIINNVTPKNLQSTFTMAESKVYFEPYKCAMEVLIKMNGDNFPMEKYIVSASNEIDIPAYLKNLPGKTYKVEQLKEFNVLNDREWPPKEKLQLDEMQYSAFKAALTKELAVIQGPPGTGKTYIGLKIMETIINNFYNTSLIKKPILVVCYTNHALDQFCEGIIQFTKNIVRIGGQTKSSIMKDYTLKSITKYHRMHHNVIRDLSQLVEIAVNKIKRYKSCKEFISKNIGIVELSLLKKGMPTSYHNFFNDPVKYLDWLFYDDDFFSFDPITLLKDHELIIQSTNTKTFLETKNTNSTEDDFFQYETEDPDMNFDYQDIVVYSLTLQDIQNYCNDKIEQLLNMKTRKRIRSYKGQYFTDFGYHQFRDLCENLKKILIYFSKMLTLANNNNSGFQIIPKDIFTLTMRDRWSLYFQWVNNTKLVFDTKISEHEKRYVGLHRQYSELKEMECIEMLSKKHVVAMTTTGASKHRVLLEGLQSPIVVVEEAAEVLESHIIASLTRHCEHLILIGDHKQLRPSNAVYKLAREYHFDVSMFERMVNSGMPYYTLGEQHRMRPEVASLITPAIYPNLLNHVSVLERPHVRGVTKDIFFLNHTSFETEVEEISSKNNDHEASFLIMFARHLILQDYKPEQVTILTTYNGQMFKLRSLQKQYSNLDGMKIQVVDNYQGEESDIILLSLVRSNEGGNVGFLKTENRICVALSRARNGLYIMGNMDNLYNSGNLWKQIKQKLVDQDFYGDEITLVCTVHHDVFTKVSKSEDFKPISEGGCIMLCNALLNCGHYCTKICHSYDRKHQDFICQQLCTRACENNHLCKKTCAEDCGDCTVSILKTLPCGHQIPLSCHVDSKTFKCRVKVEVLLEICEHKITTQCYEKNPKCTFKCIDRLKCGHVCELNCHKNDDPEHTTYMCTKPCTKFNKNCSQNHKCLKKCYEKCLFCSLKIDKTLECGHLKKSVNCGDDIKKLQCSKHLPCQRTLKCGHKCRRKCYEKCQYCKVIINRVLPECGHTVKFKCEENSERKISCPEKCTRTLSCGHGCTGLCGDPCTSKNCKELVLKKQIKLACGHSNMWVFCCDVNKEHDVSSEYVLEKCQEPCSTKLYCGDNCPGTCGKCKQGRLHMPCEAKCNKVNPCNHTCIYPCKEMCPPCNQKCSYLCEHSKCTSPCGYPCVPCQEPCVWKCQHFKCTEVCSEYCNRPRCYEPCLKRLKCKHKCIGFCGEPCPPLCRLCDKNEVTEIFLGYEDDPNARYVYLKDCKHTFESRGLEEWIDGEKEEIVVKQCPKCRVPILNTLRFKNLTKTVLKDITEIKNKLIGGSVATEKAKSYLLRSFYSTSNQLLDIQQNVCVRFKNNGNSKLSDRDIQTRRTSIDSRFASFKYRANNTPQVIECWTSVLELVKTYLECEERIKNISDDQMKNEIADHFAWLLTVAFDHAEQLTIQQLIDINLEMVRGTRLISLYETLTNPLYRSAVHQGLKGTETIAQTVVSMKALLSPFERYYPIKDTEVLQLDDEIKAKIKGLATITDKERKAIHTAMSMSFHGRSRAQGHWLKCRNGHIYCVTECGGPMQLGKCAECGVVIGGMNHRYVPGTVVATEMDGSMHVTWSHANNMNNYVLDP